MAAESSYGKYNSLHLCDTSTQSIGHILHLSDLHVPARKRHDEFRHLFTQILAYLDQQKNINHWMVVCTGDIVDQATRFSPAQLILLRDFFQDLAQRVPVLLMAGNHDLPSASLAVQHGDVLLSIVGKRHPLPNVWYLQTSGWYVFRNLIFGVWSTQDHGRVLYSSCPTTYQAKPYTRIAQREY